LAAQEKFEVFYSDLLAARACFNVHCVVQWRIKCAVMNENVQWFYTAVFVMNREEIKYWRVQKSEV